MKVTVRNWDKWQSYRKDRGTPPWIKIHRQLMSNPEWASLSDAEKGQLVSIWIVAADKDGDIPADPRILRKVCMLDETPNINKFIQLGFLASSGCQDDVNMASSGCQDDAPEKRREEERRDREEERRIKAKSPPLKAALIELPDFISPDAWFSFLDMRKKIKKPATERACQLLVKKLIMFHNSGHDANAILDQSIVNGWQDIFEIKSSYQSRPNSFKTIEQIKMERTKQAMRDFVGGCNDGTGQEAVCFVDG